MIQINTTNQNIWFRQTLLAVETSKAEIEPQSYCFVMNREGNEINIKFQSVQPQEFNTNAVEVDEGEISEQKKELDPPENLLTFRLRHVTMKNTTLKKKYHSYHFHSI